MKALKILFPALFWSFLLLAQNDTLMFIGNEPVLKEEFVRLYKKNNSPTLQSEPLSVDDYLDLFIKYKLKVIAAKDAGYDTMKSFVDEYNRYVRLLAKNYYPDSNVVNRLLKEAYERSKVNVRVGYIVFYLPKNYTSADTQKVFEKAMEVRKKLLDGADFFETAVKYSENKDVKKNKGDSWYVDVFSLPYPLENFVFNHKVGDVSMPIHRNNAYFILKILDKKPAMGERRISHIYIRLPQNPKKEDSLKAMAKIDKIKNALDSGMSFEDVAKKYSDDKFTAIKGGDLGWIKPSSNLLTSFKKYAFSIEKTGEYTGPVRTEVGYHFIKLTDVKMPGTFENDKKTLLKELQKKERYNLATKSTTERLKKEYGYKQYIDLKEIASKITDDIFKGMWKADTFANDNRILMSFADKKFTVADFGKYLEKHQRLQMPKPVYDYVKEQYDKFVTDKIRDYELDKLPQKNSELKYIAKEYYDGILLFDITQDSVSNQSIKDTAGLRQFYLKNKLKYYDRLNLKIYSYENKKGLKLALKYLKKGLPDSVIIQKVSKKDTSFKLIKSGVFKKGDNPFADKVFQMYETGKIQAKQQYVVLKDDKKIVKILDNFKYVRGFVLADFQNYLEEKWVKRLQKRYPVKINNDVLNEVKKQLGQ